MKNIANHLKLSTIVTLLTGIASFGFLMYNIFVFGAINDRIANFEPLGGDIDRIAMGIAVGIMISFVFHILAFLSQTMRFQYTRSMNVFELGTLLIGVVSFICIIGDVGALNDVGKQYASGISTDPEMLYLYLALIPHGLFYFLQILLGFSTLSLLRQNSLKETALKDEVVFIVAQYVGFACGIFGLGFTGILLFMGLSRYQLSYLLPIYGPFLLLPYVILSMYWFIMKRNEPVTDICDDKQWHDMERAGLTVTLITLPLLMVLYLSTYLTEGSGMVLLWFPFYLFLTMLVFSGSTLFFTSREWA